MSNKGMEWEQQVIKSIQIFAQRYSTVYSKKDREISAHFEIGCFLSLIEFYEEEHYDGTIINPDPVDGSYKYLTTPSGNPNNFSYMQMTKGENIIELRQQVRIVSHIGENVSFTPDFVVLPGDTEIFVTHDPDYAKGTRGFFHVSSEQVIAAHECKSLQPFPELLVSFIGTFIAAHAWFEKLDYKSVILIDGDHLAPSLFVGGTARALHLRMIYGLQDAYPMNIIVGLHSGTWNLRGDHADIRKMKNPL